MHSESIAVKTMIKSYHELIQLPTFEERFQYLKLFGKVGDDIFGFSRFVNQAFYTSEKWRSVRNQAIIRDNGCDLGIPDRSIICMIQVHHINPVSLEQLENEDPMLFDLNNLICTDPMTHRAIHYGNESLLVEDYTPRHPGDTKLW